MLAEVKFFDVSNNSPKTNRLYTYRIPLKMKLKEDDLGLVYVDQTGWQIVQIISTYNEIKYNGTIALHDLKYIRSKVDFSLYNDIIIKKERRAKLAKMIDEMLDTPATVRMSTYLYTTKEEIDYFVEEYKELDGEL